MALRAVVVRWRRCQRARRDQNRLEQVGDLRLRSWAVGPCASSPQLQVVSTHRVPKAGKALSEAPGRRTISPTVSASSASMRPRSGSATLAGQQQEVRRGGKQRAARRGERPPSPAQAGRARVVRGSAVGQGRNPGLPRSSERARLRRFRSGSCAIVCGPTRLPCLSINCAGRAAKLGFFGWRDFLGVTDVCKEAICA